MTDLLIVITPILIRLNLLVALASVFILAISRVRALGSSSKQTIARAILLTALTAPIASAALSHVIEPTNFFKPPVQIAAAAASASATHMSDSVQTVVTTRAKTETQTALNASLLLILLTLASCATRTMTLVCDRRKLRRLSENAFTLKHVNQIKVQVSEQTSVAFAARLDRIALIILPTKSHRLALKHEFQHHRQNDLQWTKLLEAARLITGWNPLVRKALERIEELDELACDENLLGRGQIDVKRYARCLFETALAAQTKRGLAGTAQMATSQTFLKRRIEMTLQPKQPTKKWLARAAIALTTITLGATAWTSEGFIKDRRITEAQAREFAKKSKIPITVNKRVLAFLNVATGTPRARFYMRNALKRMTTYKSMIEPKLAAAGIPNDLEALAFIESGFQNTETTTSAGLWMFIPETAKRYGLEVDDAKDERLDEAKETDAAIAYLSNLQSVFPDNWNLKLLSYNAGEKYVRNLVAQTGETDVFRLADQGKIVSSENANYVPKFMAALIVINNPSLVAE